MTEFQDIKHTVRDFQTRFDTASPDALQDNLKTTHAADSLWRGMHPFHLQTGPQAIADTFWAPLRTAMINLQRRMDIFMAGDNEIDGTRWVCNAGHFVGLFDEPWLGIPPTRKATFLPYAEFQKIENGLISETAFFCDILSVMTQAGVNPLPPSTGVDIVRPGPLTHDGLLFDKYDPGESEKTLRLVNQMTEDLTSSDMGSPGDELRQTWHENMWWFGPGGIGSTYTIDRYQEQHQEPFGEGLRDIQFNGHVCRFAEGNYAGWFGWPNLSMKASGDFLGLPASDTPTEMRVVDLYRRDGRKLAENWIYIDILHFLNLQGLDILGRLNKMRRT